MKEKSPLYGLWETLKVISRFCRQHYAALSMLQGSYYLRTLDNIRVAGIETILRIKPSGGLYRVTRTEYIHNEPEKEQTWLSTYSWHSGGALMELGGGRCCVFDTEIGSIYLETFTEQGKTTVELFIKSF